MPEMDAAARRAKLEELRKKRRAVGAANDVTSPGGDQSDGGTGQDERKRELVRWLIRQRLGEGKGGENNPAGGGPGGRLRGGLGEGRPQGDGGGRLRQALARRRGGAGGGGEGELLAKLTESGKLTPENAKRLRDKVRERMDRMEEMLDKLDEIEDGSSQSTKAAATPPAGRAGGKKSEPSKKSAAQRPRKSR